jgi:hypothetical protein
MLREIAHATWCGLLIFAARLSLSIFSFCRPLSEAFAKFSQHRQSRAKDFSLNAFAHRVSAMHRLACSFRQLAERLLVTGMVR